MGKTLYLECATGISADMVVGALLDLGANEAGLRRALASLDVAGFEVVVSRKDVGGIDACDFDVVLDAAHDGHDHDMAYLYANLDASEGGPHAHNSGHGNQHHHDEDACGHQPHELVHGHQPGQALDHELTHEELHALGIAHDHDHHHEHEHHHSHDHLHHHEHRTPADIAAIIDHADLAPRARAYAHRILDIVTAAEVKAHGVAPELVLFHEVGAVDSIIDIVACAWCLDDLDVDAGIVSPLSEGTGRVRTAHGVLAVPVPAVANIVAAEGLVLAQGHRKGEFVTPTGAAIAAAVRTQDNLPEHYRIKGVGYGSGKRAYDPPSSVRAMIVEEVANASDVTAIQPGEAAETSHEASRYATFTPYLWKLETEMDDVTGEALGAVLEMLFDAGAREAHYVPVFMKKNRPGYQIEVLCGAEDISAVEAVLFAETTTIGIRRYPLDRTALPRVAVDATTCYGVVRGKLITLPDGRVRAYPEHDSVAERAQKSSVPYQDVWQAAVAVLHQRCQGQRE